MYNNTKFICQRKHIRHTFYVVTPTISLRIFCLFACKAAGWRNPAQCVLTLSCQPVTGPPLCQTSGGRESDQDQKSSKKLDFLSFPANPVIHQPN